MAFSWSGLLNTAASYAPQIGAAAGAIQGYRSGGLGGALAGGGVGYGLGGAVQGGIAGWNSAPTGASAWSKAASAIGGGLSGLGNIPQTLQNASIGGFGLNDLVGAYGEYRGADMTQNYLERTRDMSLAYADPFHARRAKFGGMLEGMMTGTRDITTSPAYKFRLGESMREVNRAAAKKGLARSGNVVAAIADRAGSLASQEFEAEFQRLGALSGATTANLGIAGGLFGELGQVAAGGINQRLGAIGTLFPPGGGAAGSPFGNRLV